MATSRYIELMKQAQREKIKLTKVIQRDIINILKETQSTLEKKAIKANSGTLTERWALDYKKAVDIELKKARKKITETTKKSIKDAADLANGVQLSFFTEIDDKFNLGLDKTFRTVFSRVPKEAMDEILSGKMYKDRMGLSERIWADTKGIKRDIDYMISKAIAEKKSVAEIAKDLDTYLNPSARKDWDWSKVYPNARKQIDYNAQRIARTSINHAFFNANIRSSAKNPFVKGMQWALSESHYERQIKPFGPDVCDDYVAHDEGLGIGVFQIDKVPIPHPQCLCSQYAAMAESLDEIGSRLNKWVNGESDEMLDKWFAEHGKEFTGENNILNKNISKSDESRDGFGGIITYIVGRNIKDIKGKPFEKKDLFHAQKQSYEKRRLFDENGDVQADLDLNVHNRIDKHKIAPHVHDWREGKKDKGYRVPTIEEVTNNKDIIIKAFNEKYYNEILKAYEYSKEKKEKYLQELTRRWFNER